MYMLVASYSYMSCIVRTLTWDPVCEIYTDHCMMQYVGITHVHLSDCHSSWLGGMSSDAIEWHRILKFQRYSGHPGTVVG